MLPPHYRARERAPQPRTLIDILHATAETFPQAAAIDDGTVLTYAELLEEVRATATQLQALGIGRGARVGIRMASGSAQLYVAILGTMLAGAAYVPVDADDPDERATLVFGEAQIDALIDATGLRLTTPLTEHYPAGPPTVDDDAWIIFTSGSTGTPKGVAVTHRSAAAFVDAESRWFLVDAPAGPLGPDDRVLAGLSVAFDASCEEMWLAFGHGACLVPAPRSLVRSGMDLGPWLIRRGITVVSTVPTLAGLWPDEALDNVRLLIVGGEACPQELIDRLATPQRQMWNTYGPTEATVVACGTQLHPGAPVSIGLPLDGWDLAVVDSNRQPVAVGEVGELIIGGVGLARYLDPAKDAEKYAPLPALGWERAYASGDHVRLEEDGLYFVGRIDDQVKIGGRRIELGEVDAGLSAVENVRSSTVVVQKTGGGDSVLVGYVSLSDPAAGFDVQRAQQRLAELMPAALVPRLHVMEELPVTTAGKVDKRALPWPLPSATVHDAGMNETERWLAAVWVEVLGVAVDSPQADFFSLGGTSLAAATLVGRIRERIPTVSVRDLYDRPRLGALAEYLDSLDPPATSQRSCAPVPRRSRLIQEAIQLPVMMLRAAQWISWLLLGNTVIPADWTVPVPWQLSVLCGLVFLTPVGRLPLAAGIIRLLTRGIVAGDYPRGGGVHLRIWTAERVADVCGARSISSAAFTVSFARMLGAQVGKGVNLHTPAPVTGLLRLGDYCCVEPEVELSGYWLDGDILHVGPVRIGAYARVGARSVLLPGSRIAEGAQVEPGSCVTGDKKVKKWSRWAGSPARKVGKPKDDFPDSPPPRNARWVPVYYLTSLLLGLVPIVALAAGAGVVVWAAQHHGAVGALASAPLGALVALAALAAVIWTLVRLLQLGLQPGVVPVRSVGGWRAWTIHRLMDDARHYLFPLYAAQLTPVWLRSLGARIGAGAEVSTAVMIPALTEVRAGAFLADDTSIAGYELGRGWLYVDRCKVGKKSFLGNSSVTGPGRKLGKNSLVAVLSSTPTKAKAGSNWWGSPPERMRRVEACADDAAALTYDPPASLKARRGVVETLRLFAPMTSAVLAAAVMISLQALLAALWPSSPTAALAVLLLGGGLVLMVAGALAMAVTTAVKWVCVRTIRAQDHPLWSRFVWLNELQDAFVETVAAPWILTHTLGTATLSACLRGLGAHIGEGAWIESYWFPEADLCHVGAGATVGPGTVVQTHLFHDRVMSLGTVTIGEGATLGAHSVVLPGSSIGEYTTIAPASLVMRGDSVPSHSRWQGNPIEPS
ncbi:Linear gramicidin synthase subunit D [Corynebacterium ciconiae DSM 44920]|uniref:Pls/PosA family non-ribosomal peptide synthetase n=1 Tax=Corynebacterium ciconiae TaxID=227319 RepID=UPI00037A9D3B|nr:Pls/PosA family non-ribosomal peptide synthetase [Corynebacterium ciconiae]WKD61973.1 Linear gramicidin synthase subunit D [Corynebacterium ciconiae DSM 44920]